MFSVKKYLVIDSGRHTFIFWDSVMTSIAYFREKLLHWLGVYR
jgi:hypothetical protein